MKTAKIGKRHGRPLVPDQPGGFTIVETLIVLAVAAIILLSVFLAIPTLQRNSRNNQRRQDVQTVLQTVSSYELNNSANIPDTATLDSYLQHYDKLSFYDPGAVSVTTPAASNGGGQIVNDTDTDHVKVYNHAKCDPANYGSATRTAAGYSDVVALYAIETSQGASFQCQQL